MLVGTLDVWWQRLWRAFTLGWKMLCVSGLYSTVIYILYIYLGPFTIPLGIVSILGVGLSIFLGFRNSAAYDRWWEARKIWGGIVNDSRSFGTEVMSLMTTSDTTESGQESLRRIQKDLIYRHIAWVNALRLHLRRQDLWEELQPFLSPAEWTRIREAKTKPTQINHRQGMHLRELHQQGMISEYARIEMLRVLKEFYNYQGRCERIKNTPFPRYYGLFTRTFLLFFILLLPLSLLELGLASIPISVLISFVFWLIEESGHLTEDPFENRFNDTPMTALCRIIEIDLREQLGETDLPPPIQPKNHILM